MLHTGLRTNSTPCEILPGTGYKAVKKTSSSIKAFTNESAENTRMDPRYSEHLGRVTGHLTCGIGITFLEPTNLFKNDLYLFQIGGGPART